MMTKKNKIVEIKKLTYDLLQESLDGEYSSTIISTTLLQDIMNELENAHEYISIMNPTICWGVECIHEAKALEMISHYELKLKKDIENLIEELKGWFNERS